MQPRPRWRPCSRHPARAVTGHPTPPQRALDTTSRRPSDARCPRASLLRSYGRTADDAYTWSVSDLAVRPTGVGAPPVVRPEPPPPVAAAPPAPPAPEP